MTVGQLITELQQHDPSLSVRESFLSPVTGVRAEKFYQDADEQAEGKPGGRYVLLRVAEH